MVLRPLETAPAGREDFVPAWEAVMRTQKQHYESCWLITQPSHAALAAELAAQIAAPQFPKIDAELFRAIALHDAGWGTPDAKTILHCRSQKQSAPKSFVETIVPEFLTAWKESIETAQSVSMAGGYMVSAHFLRLAEHRLQASDDSQPDRQRLESFLAGEQQRQKKLAAKQKRSLEELEGLTNVLQFCDLLSLYICCGAPESVVFPEYFGVEVRVRRLPDGLKFEPPVLHPEVRFSLAALRWPETKEVSSQAMVVKVL